MSVNGIINMPPVGVINNVAAAFRPPSFVSPSFDNVAAAFLLSPPSSSGGRPPESCGGLKTAVTITDGRLGLNRFACRRSDGGVPAVNFELALLIRSIDNIPTNTSYGVLGRRIEAELAAPSDMLKLARIKRISIEFERYHERTPPGDISVLQARLAWAFLLAEKAFDAHERLLKAGRNSSWIDGDMINLFNPLSRIALDIEQEFVRRNISSFDPVNIAYILCYRLIKGGPAFDSLDGDPLASFAQLPDVAHRFRIARDREGEERVEYRLRGIMRGFKIETCPFTWALNKIKFEIAKYLILVTREQGCHGQMFWLGTLNDIVSSAGRWGNYRFAAEIFGYYAEKLSEAADDALKKNDTEKVQRKLQETLERFKVMQSKALEMGRAIGIINDGKR